jgi:serine-type D-Ala-D-Ala carboxypeptidase (penicillin-binding protein 5/6)
VLPLRRRLLCAALTGLALVAPTAPALAARDDSGVRRDTVVGGPLLATRGTAVARGPGIPRLAGPISARSFLVADLGSGEVLAARDPHGRYLPASTLKTLTAVALIPELDPKGVHVAQFDDVNVEGSKVGLVTGTRYTHETLMKAMLVVSGNDAAHSLATAAGGMPRATALLNATAQRLQAHDTRAVNTSGLDAPGQVTSAYDLALITREGMRQPDYRRYVKVLRDRINAPGGASFEIYNHNKLLTRYPGTDGGKTGYTLAARHCFVVTATRGGRTLVVTLLKAETRYEDATRLLDWGFAAAGKGAAVGRLVEPLFPAPAPRGTTTEAADRSRVEDVTPVTVPAPRPRAASDDGFLSDVGGWLPGDEVSGSAAAGGAGLLVVGVGVVGLRRRARRRRVYGSSSLRLKLPVR